jgi:hypothetical protein
MSAATAISESGYCIPNLLKPRHGRQQRLGFSPAMLVGNRPHREGRFTERTEAVHPLN